MTRRKKLFCEMLKSHDRFQLSRVKQKGAFLTVSLAATEILSLFIVDETMA